MQHFHRPPMNPIHLTIATSALLAVIGCGGGGGAGPSTSAIANTAPSISNLRYSPTRAMPYPVLGQVSTKVTGTVTYVDADGIADLASLTISIPGATDFIIPRSSIIISGSDVTVNVDILLTTSGTRTFSVRATDAAGNNSNVLNADFEVGYNVSWTSAFFQSTDKSNFTISATPPALPGCSKLLAGKYVITNVSYTSAKTCVPIAFSATTPGGAFSQWGSLLGSAAACGIDSSGQVIKQPLDFTKYPMWGFTDSSTQSSYNFTVQSNGTAFIEAQLYCK